MIPDHYHSPLDQQLIHWVCDINVSFEEIFRQP
jgi:hypothetical protein